MKTLTSYQCDFCGCVYENPKDAYKCEAACLGITVDQYTEYLKLLEEETHAFQEYSIERNEFTKRRCDKAVKAVIDFQKKYGFTDDR